MCGEKLHADVFCNNCEGSPPHVRGKAYIFHTFWGVERITPACAGKSVQRLLHSYNSWDHPRMCGEKRLPCCYDFTRTGSPPHVRGKGCGGFHGRITLGITPACAGKRLKRSRSTVPHAAIVPLFPSVCNKPAGSDGSLAGHDAPPFLPIENAAPASPAYNLRSL